MKSYLSYLNDKSTLIVLGTGIIQIVAWRRKEQEKGQNEDISTGWGTPLIGNPNYSVKQEEGPEKHKWKALAKEVEKRKHIIENCQTRYQEARVTRHHTRKSSYASEGTRWQGTSDMYQGNRGVTTPARWPSGCQEPHLGCNKCDARDRVPRHRDNTDMVTGRQLPYGNR